MNAIDLIYPTIFIAAALLAAVVLIFTQGAFIAFERQYSAITLTFVPLLMCFGMAAGTLLSGRSLRFAEQNLLLLSEDGAGGGASSLQRVATAVVLAVCLAKILTSIWTKSKNDASSMPVAILFGFLAFFISTNVLAPAISADHAFSHNSFYPVIVFLAVYACRGTGFDAGLRGLRLGLLILVIGGLLLAVLKPDMALQSGYGVMLPGIKFRLWGLNAHANGAGAIGLILMVVIYVKPFDSRIFNLLAILVAAVVFILAQSKTIWVAAFAVGCCFLYYRNGRDAHGKIKPYFLLFIVFVLASFAIGLSFVDFERVLRKFVVAREYSQLESATGRTQIWEAALTMWRNSFWFGNGPDAWGPLQRARLGMPFALHAHNQFLQVLSTAGTIGGLCFGFYFVAMAVASVKAARATGGASIAVLLYMLIRSMTETPLGIKGLFSEDMVVHLFWLILVLVPYQIVPIRCWHSTNLTDPVFVRGNKV